MYLRTYSAVLLVSVVMSSFCFGQSVGLSFRPVAAEYSTQLDRIIMISGNPNLLHIYSPQNQADTTVLLSKPPLSLAVSPDGMHALVGHDQLVSYVNLSTAAVEKATPISVSAQNVALSNSWIYVLPAGSASTPTAVSINIATGAVVYQGSVFFNGGAGRFNPAVNAIYGTRDGVSPNDIEKYDVSTGPITQQTDSIYHGDYNICGPVFFSDDGSRIYTGCSTVFLASTNNSVDMRYFTTVPSAASLLSLTESTTLKRLALIQAPRPFGVQNVDDSVVLLYESAYLNPAGQFALSDFQAGSRSFKAHGKWVFFSADSAVLYAIKQADTSSGLLNDFAVQTFATTASASCAVSFGATNANVVGDGSTLNVNVIAPAGCTYQASSNVPWIAIISGGYGSGNGTLTYVVRSNLGDTRSGALSLGSSVLTVTQSRASTAAVTRLPYSLVAMEYQKRSDKLIFATVNPNELHVYDPVSRSDQFIKLPVAPISLSVSPDGTAAAVAHDGMASYVDLRSMAVAGEYRFSARIIGQQMASNGFMYLLAEGQVFPPIYAVNVVSGATTTFQNTYGGRVTRLSSDQASIYVGSSYVTKIPLDGSTVRTNFNVSSCNNLWLTEDGRRLVTGCGRLYRSSAIPSEDLQPNGSLAPLGNIISADDSIAAHTLAVIPIAVFSSQIQGSATLQLYDDAFLEFAGVVTLPGFTVNGNAYAGYGQFVSWSADGTRLIVVEKADPTAQLLSPFGVAVIPPSTAGRPFTLPDRGVFSVTTSGIPNTVTVGSAQILPASNSSIPAGLAIFGSRQNGVLVSEATVPAVLPTTSGRIYAEVKSNVKTGVAIANPASTAAQISFYFTDQAGNRFGSGTTVIPANGQIAAFLSEPPFNGGPLVDGTFTFQSDVAVGAIALRGLINERGEFLWTTTPVLSLNTFVYDQVFPSFADGGGWSTQFVLVNTWTVPMRGTLQFGSGVTVTIDGQTGNRFPYSIPGGSSRKFTTSGYGSTVQVGSVLLVPDPGQIPATGFLAFSQKNPAGITISESGVPIVQSSQAVRLYAESTNDSSQIQTGIAIANPSANPVNATLEITPNPGTFPTQTATVSIPAGGQVQMFLNQIPGFQNLPPFQGMLRSRCRENGITDGYWTDPAIRG